MANEIKQETTETNENNSSVDVPEKRELNDVVNNEQPELKVQ